MLGLSGAARSRGRSRGGPARTAPEWPAAENGISNAGVHRLVALESTRPDDQRVPRGVTCRVQPDERTRRKTTPTFIGAS